MSKEIKLYPYGFIFSDKFIKSVPERYTFMKVLGKYNYHYDSIYNPGVYEDNTSFIIIHGHFVHIGLEHNINNEDLPQYLLDKYINEYDSFLDTLDFIAGRFVIIICKNDSIRIYPDAANARSTYYATNNLIIGSHPNLINDNFNFEKDPLHEEVPLFSVTLDYSPYKKIRRALPNYFVDMDTYSSTRFYPRGKNKYTNLGQEQRLLMLEHFWKSQLKYYNNKYKNIVLSLSGGNDSRLSLAMAREYNKKIKTFTYTTKKDDTGESSQFSKIMSLDQYVVKQILKDIDLNHRFFYTQDKSKKLTDIDLETLDRNTIKHHGRPILPYYLHEFPEEKVIHIRTSVLEITTAYYYKSDKKDHLSSARNTMKNGFRKFIDLVGEDTIDQKLDETLERLKYGENTYDYHILDLYFWENRIGAWHTEVLNETDSAFDTLLPFNHRALIEVASSFPLPIRRSESIFKELINRNHPVLNFYGLNQKSNLYEQYRDFLNSLENSKTKFFESFIVTNLEKDESYEIKSEDNIMFIPEKHITKDNFSEITFKFKLNEGIVILDIHSKYRASRGKDYIIYQVFKNNELLLTEDIAEWNLPNQVNIMNMKKDDLISVRVTSLKNSRSESWQRASKIYINNYQELESKIKNDVKVTCTSPFSKLNK